MPDDCLAPLSSTSIESAIVFAKSVGSNGVRALAGGGDGDNSGGGDDASGGGGEASGGGAASGGGDDASGGGEETDTGSVPVSTKGVTMFPALPLTEKTTVSPSGAVPLPVVNSKPIVSPSVSA